MTNAGMPALLNRDDYETFENLDLEWFLAAAGAAIRRYCGWHVFPSLSQTQWCVMAGDGTIILPSAHATSVESITLPWSGQVLDANTYWLDQTASVIRRKCASNGSSAWWGVHSLGSTNAYPKYAAKVEVSFTHGFSALPPEVAETGMELCGRTLEKPAGVAKSVQAGPYYRFDFNEFGMYLSDSQKNRLAAYKLPAIF